MSTIVTYKDNTLTTVDNATKTLKTAGKYMESDVVLTDTTVDLSSDTVTPDTLMQGYTAHDKSGALITGTAISSSVSQDNEGYIVLPDQGGSKAITTLKMGVIRPDAELIQKWTYDRMVVADDGIALPEYSTIASTLIASKDLAPTVQIDVDTNDYMALERYLIIPSYSSDTISEGRFAGYAYYRAVEIYNKSAFTVNGGTTVSGLTSRQTTAETNAIYWSSATTLVDTPQNVGIYISNYGSTISNNVVTYRSPNLIIKGSTTFFTAENWNNLTDIRYQYIIEFYKVKKGSLNIDGFTTSQLNMLVADCFNSPSKKLI